MDTPQIQGSYVGWANINLSLESYSGPSFQTSDISALDWEQSLEPTKVQGTGPMHRARTVGMYDSSASMSMYYDKAVEFQAALQSSGGRGYMLVPFDIVCSYEPLDGDGRIHTVKIIGCRIASEAVKNAPGGDATVIEFGLSIDRIEKITPDGTVLKAL